MRKSFIYTSSDNFPLNSFMNVANNYSNIKEESEEEEDMNSDSNQEDDEFDDTSSINTSMTQKEAILIFEMAKNIIMNQKNTIDNPLVFRAIEIHNQNQTDIENFEQQMTKFRKFCYRLSLSTMFNNFILLIVIINVITFIFQTDPNLNDRLQYYISAFDQVCFGLHIFEAIIKINGFRKTYFSDPWNDLDFFIVFLSFIDYITLALSSSIQFNPSVIRAFRIFRTLRALKAVKMLKNNHFRSLLALIDSVASSFSDCIWSLLLLLIIMYFYAFIGLILYREVSPHQFGDFSRAFFSMFQLCTLDDWFNVYDSVKSIPEGSIFFFISFIIICSFIIMNYITAVLTDKACQSAVEVNETSDWIRKLVQHYNSEHESKRSMKSKSHSGIVPPRNITNTFPELKNMRKNDISQIIAILGEIERTEIVTNGHKAIFGELIDQALTNGH